MASWTSHWYSRKDTVREFLSVVSDDLLRYLIENDEDVMLVGDTFEIPIKLSFINRFVPIMKTALETLVGKYETDTIEPKKIEVSCFDEKTTALFVKIFQERRELDITSLSWEEALNLIKFAHFYQCEILLKMFYRLIEKRVNVNNIYDAIALMDLLGFDDWKSKCCELLKNDKNVSKIINNEKWRLLIEKCPKIVAIMLSEIYVQKNEPYVTTSDHSPNLP